MRFIPGITSYFIAMTCALPIAQAALADTPDQSQSKVWDISLGAGAAYAPTYEGSDNYTATALPYISIKYEDWLAFGVGGLTADIWKNESTTLGVGLTYSAGRDENGNTIFGSGNDHELEGMGDIDGAAGAKVYATHEINSFKISADITQYLGDDNDGLLVDSSLSRLFEFNRQFSLTPSIGATWANGNYMHTFFGVDEDQARQSRFSRYTADAGFKDITAGVRAMYKIDKNWAVIVSGQVKQLLGDAADSPISVDDTSFSLMSVIDYRF